MALKVFRTPRARADLVEIWNYIADDNETAVDGTDAGARLAGFKTAARRVAGAFGSS
jgi:plasmid stabilization system protein ParE